MSSRISTSALPSTPAEPEPELRPHPALELVDILEQIFSHIRPVELLQIRLVCQNWNDIIVNTLNTTRKNSFPLRLRYGPQVPLSLGEWDAEELTREILKSPPTISLTDSTGITTNLSFDTVVVDNDFYLAGVNPQWQQFLGIHGESIRHFKFNIRSGKEREDNSHQVKDCAQIVSRENLRAAFSTVPNLESLDFSVRFTSYETQESAEVSQRMFPEARQITDLPQLKNLIKITIQQPQEVQYVRGFLKEILGMAPNLTTLYLKWAINLSTVADVMCSLPNLNESLTTLGITMTDPNTSFQEIVLNQNGFSRFHLTKLELNGITGTGFYLEEFLQTQASTLKILKLGDRVTPQNPLTARARRHECKSLYRNPLCLPLMDSLKILELNLPKFKMAPITSYPNQFPVLEELMFSNCEDMGCVWEYRHLQHLLPGVTGQSDTVKKFTLLGAVRAEDRNIIIAAISSTFPFAELYFRL